jgi:hypothetical protein
MTNQRFVLNSEGYVVDKSNSKVSHYFRYETNEGDTSENPLREDMLFAQLCELVDKLLVNNNAVKQTRSGPYQDKNPENYSLALIIYQIIKESRLNGRHVLASLQHKPRGKLRPNVGGWQDITSIALFINDIECLLRDLYGDFDDDDAIGPIRRVILVVVPQFLRLVRNDLWLEHSSAVDIDDQFDLKAIDLGICPGDLARAAFKGTAYLLDRVQEFRRNPSPFSQYTASFLTAYESQCALATANDFTDFGPV